MKRDENSVWRKEVDAVVGAQAVEPQILRCRWRAVVVDLMISCQCHVFGISRQELHLM
jgi:hypothetical protein